MSARLSTQDLHGILAKIRFAPSCVDMAWRWDVEEIFVRGLNWTDRELAGFRLRTTFQRPDRDTGVIGRGFGRWWEVPLDVTESGVVKTAFAAAKMILEHELMESFRYDGVRLFDPHHDIVDLLEAAASRTIRDVHTKRSAT